MAMRIKMGQYEVDEIEEITSRRKLWFVLVGGVVIGLVVLGSQGFSAGFSTSELTEDSDIVVRVPVPAVFASASSRGDESVATEQVRPVVYREPLLLDEPVSPRIHENLKSVAIRPLGVSRERDEPRAVHAPFRMGAAEVTHSSNESR